MFARLLELNIKIEKKNELLKKMKDEILPILKKQTGYVDTFAFENEFEPNKPYVVTFWHTKQDVERYEKETYTKIKQTIEPYCNVPPVAKWGKVEETLSAKLFDAVMV